MKAPVSTLKSLGFLLALGLVACSRELVEKGPPPRHNACSRIALQSKVWTPEITRDVLSCLLSKDTDASLKIQEIPAENFKHLSRYLSEAFENPTKRKALALILARTREATPLLGPLFREKLVVELGSQKSFVNAMPWLSLSMESLEEILVNRPEVLLDWLDAWNKMNPDGELLRNLHAPVSALLGGIQSVRGETGVLFGISHRIFSDLSMHPNRLASLARLSKEQICSSPTNSVVTDSPMALTLRFFREDRLNPQKFVNSVQQGFGYWSRVCRPLGDAHTQEDVNAALSFIFGNWEDLQNFFESPKSQDWIPAGQKLIILAADRSAEDENSALLNWLFSSEVTTTLVASLQQNPAKLEKWIRGFGELAPWIREIPNSQLALSPDFAALAREDTSWALLLHEVAQVPTPVLQELWALAQITSPGGIKDLAPVFESDEAAELIRFLEWILNVREKPSVPQIDSRVRNPVAGEASPIANEIESARKVLEECLRDKDLDVIEECLLRSGLPTPPPLIRELWKLPNSSQALHAAQHADVFELANPALARTLWNPLITWIVETKLNPKPTLDLIGRVSDLAKKKPRHAWNGTLSKFWTQFQITAPALLSPGGPAMRMYRRERSADIKSEFFSDVELRDRLLSPTFFKRILKWTSQSPDSLPARRALVNLQRTRFPISFWSQEGRLETLDVTATEALDLLFWELQIPVISSPGMIRGVLESWDALGTSAEVVRWLDSKDSQLGLAIGLSGVINNPGYGIRRRLENAQFIVKALSSQTRLHADLLRATRALELFKDKGRFTNATTKSLMALHQFGFLAIVADIFSPSSAWVHRLESGETLAVSDKLVEDLASHLRRLVDLTPPDDLRAVASGQLRQELWVMRSAATVAINTLANDPSFVSLVESESASFFAILRDAHSQVFLPWLHGQRGKSEIQQDMESMKLRSILLALKSPPKAAWISLAGELGRSPELGLFWTQIPRMNRPEIERLSLWLETGIPQRLLQWNRLMNVQNPDANSSALP